MKLSRTRIAEHDVLRSDGAIDRWCPVSIKRVLLHPWVTTERRELGSDLTVFNWTLMGWPAHPGIQRRRLVSVKANFVRSKISVVLLVQIGTKTTSLILDRRK